MEDLEKSKKYEVNVELESRYEVRQSWKKVMRLGRKDAGRVIEPENESYGLGESQLHERADTEMGS